MEKHHTMAFTCYFLLPFHLYQNQFFNNYQAAAWIQPNQELLVLKLKTKNTLSITTSETPNKERLDDKEIKKQLVKWKTQVQAWEVTTESQLENNLVETTEHFIRGAKGGKDMCSELPSCNN